MKAICCDRARRVMPRNSTKTLTAVLLNFYVPGRLILALLNMFSVFVSLSSLYLIVFPRRRRSMNIYELSTRPVTCHCQNTAIKSSLYLALFLFCSDRCSCCFYIPIIHWCCFPLHLQSIHERYAYVPARTCMVFKPCLFTFQPIYFFVCGSRSYWPIAIFMVIFLCQHHDISAS